MLFAGNACIPLCLYFKTNDPGSRKMLARPPAPPGVLDEAAAPGTGNWWEVAELYGLQEAVIRPAGPQMGGAKEDYLRFMRLPWKRKRVIRELTE